MKKYFVFIGAALLAMALVSPAMAQAPTEPFKVGYNVQAPITTPFSEFKTWGHLEIQTIWESKPDFNTGRPFRVATQNYNNSNFWANDGSKQNQDMTWRHVAERFRMHFQYGDAKTVRAVLGFEADSQDWGEAAGGGTGGNQGNNTGTGAGYNGGANHMGVYVSDQVQLEVMWAFLEFMVPNTPVQIAAGIQRFMVGGRMWMQNDAPGVKIRTMFAPHNVELFWWRQNDRSRNQYQPNDYYGAQYSLDQKDFNVYAWGAYNNDLYNSGTSGVTPTGGTFQNSPGATVLPIPYTNINPVAPSPGTTFPGGRFAQSNNPYWLALGGGFRPGNFDLSGQFIYNGGKVKMNTGSDFNYKAWALELAGKYRIGPGMFAGLEYFYATGNDADKSDQINYYTVPLATESTSIFGNDRTVFFWMNAAQMGYYNNRNAYFAGMSYYRGNFEYSPTAWVRFNFNYLYIEDTSKGTPGPGKIVNSPIGARQDIDSRKIGQEFNLITTLNIHKGLQYHIGLAYFLPGEIYSVPGGGVSATGQPIPSKSAEAAYAVNTKLIYAF